MAQERIMIVEDEQIVAEDLRLTLKQMGYDVVGMASSGEKAVELAEKLQPDLILMDIRLEGGMDGIEAAEQITAQWSIPVTYLTAYADEPTLQRAKTTLPFGYILKPFEERDIRTTIEMALYKSKIQSVVNSIDEWHATALQSLPEPVIAVDSSGRVIFINRQAELFLHAPFETLYQKRIQDILAMPTTAGASWLHQTTSQELEATLVASKNGGSKTIPVRVAPLHNSTGDTTGRILVLRTL